LDRRPGSPRREITREISWISLTHLLDYNFDALQLCREYEYNQQMGIGMLQNEEFASKLTSKNFAIGTIRRATDAAIT
jgi:hypothetical protein